MSGRLPTPYTVMFAATTPRHAVEVFVRRALVVMALSFSVACNRAPAAQSQTGAPAAAGQPGQATQPGTAKPAAGTPGAPGAQGQPTPPPAKPVPAVLPQVVARVNGEDVGKGELERAIRNVEGRAGRPVPQEQRDQVYRGVLDELLAFKLVQAEGKARGITVTEPEIDGRIGELRKNFQTEDAFTQALKGKQMTLVDLKNETRTELLVNKTMEAEVAPKVNVTPQDLDTYYKEHPDQFKQPEQLRASHILFAVDGSATEDFKKTTRGQAEAVLKRAQAGEDFAGLAKQFSKDSSAANGGDLNFFPRGQMVPSFDQAAFALKPGEISGIVESQFGYHIIKVTDYKPARAVPLAEVNDRLTQFLRQRKQQELIQQFVQSLRTKYKVEVLL
jgi:peptidyl-prolyl cis-trans isomerase C